ncbi:hypothetical protein B296_00007010 [Ensete ventricosum]|uniref:Uncharacterized protein n=1 Tax=Ensete ventricosum TaxID=4639 RepID=A0A427B0W8_ENSVE|nr:hypothetical protein B296_00007010 [Ensete ventricosum]
MATAREQQVVARRKRLHLCDIHVWVVVAHKRHPRVGNSHAPAHRRWSHRGRLPRAKAAPTSRDYSTRKVVASHDHSDDGRLRQRQPLSA